MQCVIWIGSWIRKEENKQVSTQKPKGIKNIIETIRKIWKRTVSCIYTICKIRYYCLLIKILNSTPAEIGTFITQSEPIIVNQQLQ